MSEQLQTQLEQLLAQADPKALETIRAYEQIKAIYDIAMLNYQKYLAALNPHRTITTDRTWPL